MKKNILKKLKNKIIVSCQPNEDGPQDKTSIIVSMAKAATLGGCGGVRIEGEKNIRAVKKNISVPIIGIIKNDLANYKVRITPLLKDVEKIINSGADIIAYDATNRKRPFPTKEIILKIKKANRLAMADCSNIDDAKNAILEGADIIGTTLAGYVGKKVKDTDKPNIKLVKEFKKLNCFVMAEGRYNSPELAKKAIQAGADAVTIGSAITRIDNITSWFVKKIKN
ncbi:putative N-acetylmannosamine-6-phosphate 2-epimerase [Pelagibacteraceae bacterium]|nr:putative N-acetylmannosamine-6-phosphate 2-epimerase [Pelagibacteraceae bacterium]